MNSGCDRTCLSAWGNDASAEVLDTLVHRCTSAHPAMGSEATGGTRARSWGGGPTTASTRI